MLLIRRFEEKAGQLYGMGKIGGFCHLYIGQEAVVVGVDSVKKKGDQVIIISYASIELSEAKNFKPTVIFPDENNQI